MAYVHDGQLESYFPLNELPKRLPPRPNGRALHRSIGFRWATTGVSGHRLKVIRIGRMAYTSDEFVREFVQKITAAIDTDQPADSIAAVDANRVEAQLADELDEILE